MRTLFRNISLSLYLALSAISASALPSVSVTETPLSDGGTAYTVTNNSASSIAFFAVTNNIGGSALSQRPEWMGLAIDQKMWDAGITIFSYQEPTNYIHTIAQTGTKFSDETLFTIDRHSINPNAVTLLGNFADLFGNTNTIAYLFFGIWGTTSDILSGETTTEFSVSAPPASEYAAWTKDGALIYASANSNTPLPEPGSLALIVLSLVALIFIKRHHFHG